MIWAAADAAKTEPMAGRFPLARRRGLRTGCTGPPPPAVACPRMHRAPLKVVLVAADALGAIGAKRVLEEIGLAISLITGPCTETPTLRERTETLCGIPAINLFRSSGQETQ